MLGWCLVGAAQAAEMPPEALAAVKRVAIQHNGRLKPFDSFAWESLEHLTGGPRYQAQDPVETVVSMLTTPEAWQDVPLLQVPFLPLREHLGMDRRTSRISYNELVATRKLMRLLPAIAAKQQRDEKLTMMEQETWDAYDRFVALTALLQQDLRVVPPPPGRGPEWLPILEPEGHPRDAQLAVRNAWTAWVTAVRDGQPQAMTTAARQVAEALRAVNPSAYPAQWRLELEVFYNRTAPFLAARTLYVVAMLALMLALASLLGWASTMGMAALWTAFAIHAAGIAIRVVLGGRPPVSNFYETMLWLPFVAVLLALVFEGVYRVKYFGIAAALLAAVTLELARHVPLDASIAPVVAVLRSNLWLTIHVLTIVASYGALALATVLAHIYGWLYLRRAGRHPALASLDLFLYRAIQVGVVLLAGGVMLGAVWANASWGRYWGWDPKETWALITLLWFLAVLHGRFAGWLRGVGVALCTIGGFFLLLMTYYGVSFYLVGLHSYAGGHATPLPALLIAYLIAEVAFMAAVGLSALAAKRLAS
ncbi:MAG: cytochrome c biogenesis protein CcsA [Candidatus Omnitrophica bacterium]|nr:cytochrome c biogenesis protein CcsA [Candidatus Omnitrophota bacterium]